jgi:hypothetical protein
MRNDDGFATKSSYAERIDPALAKRWLAGHQAAGRRALQVMPDEGAASPKVSFARSMELLDLAPTEDDGFRDREATHARAAWAKLRAWARQALSTGIVRALAESRSRRSLLRRILRPRSN